MFQSKCFVVRPIDPLIHPVFEQHNTNHWPIVTSANYHLTHCKELPRWPLQCHVQTAALLLQILGPLGPVAPSTRWPPTTGHTLASGKALSKAYLLAASAAPPTNMVRQQCQVTLVEVQGRTSSHFVIKILSISSQVPNTPRDER